MLSIRQVEGNQCPMPTATSPPIGSQHLSAVDDENGIWISPDSSKGYPTQEHACFDNLHIVSGRSFRFLNIDLSAHGNKTECPCCLGGHWTFHAPVNTSVRRPGHQPEITELAAQKCVIAEVMALIEQDVYIWLGELACCRNLRPQYPK